MTWFDLPGYQPRWLNGYRAIAETHGPRLHALTGRRLSHAWLAWDLRADDWFADCPVLLDFDGEQVELTHQKFDDLSITWNTVDPVRRPTWRYGDPADEEAQVRLGWRSDAEPRLAMLRGQPLVGVELLEWAGEPGDAATGMVAVSFVFTDGRVTVANNLDENGLEFGPPGPAYRLHTMR